MMATKISRREFQEALVARLQNLASGDAQAHATKLGVKSGSKNWLINLSDVSEVVPLGAFTPVPLTKPWFIGMTNVRGNLFSIVDFSSFSGNEPTAMNVDSRLLLLNLRFGVNAALLVNRMQGLRGAEQLEPVAATGEQPAWVGGTFNDASGTQWQELDLAALVQTSEFLQVGL